MKKGEFQFTIYDLQFTNEMLVQLLVFVFVGLIIGGRFGYVLFYEPLYYLRNPLAIISPFDNLGNYAGIYGMSYFGGLVGGLSAAYLFLRLKKQSFFVWADFIVPAVPLGYFFGRLGNFINGELYGRITKVTWGMQFPANQGGLLRHPSQLYEAFGEGIVLFVFLWMLRNKAVFSGQLLLIYISGYAFVRFVVEFFREEKKYDVFGCLELTEGQILSAIAFIVALSMYYFRKRRYGIIKS